MERIVFYLFILSRIPEEDTTTTEAPTLAEVVVETVGNAVGVATFSTGCVYYYQEPQIICLIITSKSNELFNKSSLFVYWYLKAIYDSKYPNTLINSFVVLLNIRNFFSKILYNIFDFDFQQNSLINDI